MKLRFLIAMGIILCVFPIHTAHASCADVGASRLEIVAPNTGTYMPGQEYDMTLFFVGNSDCQPLTIRTRVTMNAGGSLHTLKEMTCPTHDSGDGNFCEKADESTWQMHIVGKLDPTWGLTYPSAAIEGWAYAGDTWLYKTPAIELQKDLNAPSAVGSSASTAIAAIKPVTKQSIQTRLAVPIGSLVSTNSVGVYVGTLFNLLIGLVGTFATVMLVLGGIKYLTAGGNSGQVSAAKETIINAIVGLALSMGSILILNTINPALTKLKDINVPNVARVSYIDKNVWCEDLIANNKFIKVIPGPPGHCGTEGKITNTDTNNGVSAETCHYRTCDKPTQTCLPIKGQYTCSEEVCEALGELRLRALGLPLKNETCTKNFPMKPLTNGFEQCVFTSQNNGCGRLVMDCTAMQGKTCADYATVPKIMIAKTDKSQELRSDEKTDTMETSVQDAGIAFQSLCESDPCHVGPCTAVAEESIFADNIFRCDAAK